LQSTAQLVRSRGDRKTQIRGSRTHPPASLPPGAAVLLTSGYRYALSLTHDASAAEDLLQDACLAILGAGGPWERPYLFVTLRNKFIDHCRREAKIRFLSLEGGDELRPLDAADDWEAPDALRYGQLERALGALRFEEREALFLAAVEGYTADEIGKLTSRPRGTVLSLLHRAKAKLRTLLDNQDEVRR
jgi:RNA polymerase sigma-70 factor (ECF subfamily)